MAYLGKIENNSDLYPVAPTLYGTCETAAADANKVVILPEYTELITGSMVQVKFRYGNSATNLTMNINGTGVYPIYRYGTTSPGSGERLSWFASSVVSFLFDGDAWVMVDSKKTDYDDATTSEHGLMTAADKAKLDDVQLNKIVSATGVSVAASLWASNSTYSGYGYRAAVPITGMTAEHIPIVAFNPANITAYTLAPIAVSYAGGIYIYCATKPSGAITIPSVLGIKAG